MTEPQQTFDIIINRRSGTVLNTGESTVQKSLESILGDRLGSLTFVEGQDVAAAVKSWSESEREPNRGIIIGGGDGTVLTAAGLLMGRDDIAMGVLPLGTHNLFARQLGFSADFKKATEQYKDSEVTDVDVGQVNGMNFLIGLMLDQNIVDFYEAREDLRDEKIFTAYKKIFGMASGVTMGSRSILRVSDPSTDEPASRVKGHAFVISTGAFQPRPSKVLSIDANNVKEVIENILAKGDKSEGKLAFYAISGGLNGLSMVKSFIDGTWTKHPSVSTKSATQLVIQPRAGASEKTVPIVLDGEVCRTEYPLHVKVMPKALRVYKPS